MIKVPKMREFLFTLFSEVELSWSRFSRNSQQLNVAVCRSLVQNFIQISQKRAKLGYKVIYALKPGVTVTEHNFAQLACSAASGKDRGIS
jgi:hypothetical protein